MESPQHKKDKPAKSAAPVKKVIMHTGNFVDKRDVAVFQRKLQARARSKYAHKGPHKLHPVLATKTLIKVAAHFNITVKETTLFRDALDQVRIAVNLPFGTALEVMIKGRELEATDLINQLEQRAEDRWNPKDTDAEDEEYTDSEGEEDTDTEDQVVNPVAVPVMIHVSENEGGEWEIQGESRSRELRPGLTDDERYERRLATTIKLIEDKLKEEHKNAMGKAVSHGPSFTVDIDLKRAVYDYFKDKKNKPFAGAYLYIVVKVPPSSDYRAIGYNITVHSTLNPSNSITTANLHVD